MFMGVYCLERESSRQSCKRARVRARLNLNATHQPTKSRSAPDSHCSLPAGGAGVPRGMRYHHRHARAGARRASGQRAQRAPVAGVCGCAGGGARGDTHTQALLVCPAVPCSSSSHAHTHTRPRSTMHVSETTWEHSETPPVPVGLFRTCVSLDVCVGSAACTWVSQSGVPWGMGWCVLSRCRVCVCVLSALLSCATYSVWGVGLGSSS